MPFFLFPQSCALWTGGVVLGRSGGQGSVFIYSKNEFVFLLYHFFSFLLKEVYFCMCAWECVGRPYIPGKCSNSYRPLGLGKGTPKAIAYSHVQTWLCQWIHTALKNSAFGPCFWKFWFGHYEDLESDLSKKQWVLLGSRVWDPQSESTSSLGAHLNLPSIWRLHKDPMAHTIKNFGARTRLPSLGPHCFLALLKAQTLAFLCFLHLGDVHATQVLGWESLWDPSSGTRFCNM